MVDDGTKIRFWEDLEWGDQPLCSQFPRLSRVTITRNLSISVILGNGISLSWKLIFYQNLTDLKIENPERLMTSLFHVHLSPFVPNAKALVPSSSGVFSVKSFLLALFNLWNSVPFHPAKFLWKSRVSSKIMAFAWLVAHKKVHTNDMLQLRRSFKALSLDWCIICKGSAEMIIISSYIV